MPSLSGGGAERVMATLLKHLDRARFEPLLALPAQTGPVSGVPEDVPLFDLKCSRVRRAVFKLTGLVR
ncbi:MAG: glycosyltransferase, partial [Thermodesulfobacteriota bacterium]|nr:glycosyltransferase [Thermodesulfobacteriota bacterium]